MDNEKAIQELAKSVKNLLSIVQQQSEISASLTKYISKLETEIKTLKKEVNKLKNKEQNSKPVFGTRSER